MIPFLKKYKAFLFGYTIIVPLFYLLDFIGLIILPEERTYEIVIYSLIWGYIIALPIHYFDYIKQKRETVYKILGLFLLASITLFIDSRMKMPDNPITLILLITFWIGVLYLILPKFFYKYKFHIIGIYALILGYFTYVRLSSETFEGYLSTSKHFALGLMFIPIPLFILLWIFEQWKAFKVLKAGKTKAELDLLKTQINPHFFFNTLNNLYSLTVKQSPEAPKIILKLSEMMRYTIYEGKKDSVSLAYEIDYLKNYIDLHKIRYRKTVDITFDHKVDENTEVAPLMFIVPLENAIKHGVESLSDNAYIKMTLKSEENNLIFSIENNFDPKEIQEKMELDSRI